MQTPPTHPSSICTHTHLSIQPYVHNMNASIPYSNHHTFIHPFTPTSIYDSIHLPICLPTPSIHISIHVFVSTYTYIYTCMHPSIHHPSFYLPIHLSITYPHVHTFLDSVCKVSSVQSVIVLIVWDELEWALFSFPQEPWNLMQQTLSRYRFSIWEFRLYVSNLMTS